MADAQKPLDLTVLADEQVAAYRNAKPRYITGRRDAALLMAVDPRHTPSQVAYWKRIADGCDALLKRDHHG